MEARPDHLTVASAETLACSVLWSQIQSHASLQPETPVDFVDHSHFICGVRGVLGQL